MKVFWHGTDKVPGEEDVEYAANERDLFPDGDHSRIGPSLAKLVHVVAHALAVLVELLIRSRYPSPPFINDLVLCADTTAPELLLLPPYLFSLGGYRALDPLKVLWQGKVLEDIKHSKSV